MSESPRWPEIDDNRRRSPEDSHSIVDTPEFGIPDIYEDIPVGDEIPAMDAWEEQHADELSMLSKPKQRKAFFEALQELRAQRAREKIEASSPDQLHEPDSGYDAST